MVCVRCFFAHWCANMSSHGLHPFVSRLRSQGRLCVFAQVGPLRFLKESRHYTPQVFDCHQIIKVTNRDLETSYAACWWSSGLFSPRSLASGAPASAAAFSISEFISLPINMDAPVK